MIVSPVYIIFGAQPASNICTGVFVAASINLMYVPFRLGRLTGRLARKEKYEIDEDRFWN